jgi:hypothetical protein
MGGAHDEPAPPGPDPVVYPHQGAQLPRVLPRHGVAQQFLQQYRTPTWTAISPISTTPRRDPRFDWKHPVDGKPATEWQGLHKVSETIQLFNPRTGWIQNTNNWPYTAAGAYSPKASDYPAYMSLRRKCARHPRAARAGLPRFHASIA